MNYSDLMDKMYAKAHKLGKLSKHSTEAWLLINEVWWPNPHYKGKQIPNPDDPNGTETNPKLPNSLERTARP